MRKVLLILFVFLSALVVAQPPNPTALWEMNETTGTSIDDAVGTNNLTTTATTTVGSTTALNGRSLYFDGNDDYATLTTPLTNTVATYIAWVRISSIPDDLVLMGNGGFDSRIFFGASNNFQIETNTNGQQVGDFTSWATNTWYLAGIVRNGTSVKFFRNGVQLGTTQTLSGNSNLTVSAIGWVGRSFRGYIDQVAIWNGTALSDANMLALYNSGTPLTYPYGTSATVTTAAITNIVGSTATGGGNVTSDGGSTVTARGICWNTSTSPTLANVHTTESGTTGAFVSTLSGLATDATYYVRAYVTNGTGTVYGSEVSFSTGAVTLLDNLIFHFQLEETSGDAIDVISGIHGTNSGVIQNVTGHYKKGYDYDGVNDYTSLGDSPNWTVNTTDNITVSAWIKFDANLSGGNNYATIVGQDIGPAFSLLWISNGNYKMTWYCGGGEAQSTTQAYTMGQWYHIAMVKTGLSVIFYRDGTAVNTVNSLTDINLNPSNMYLGGDIHVPPEVFNGVLDEVSFYRRALSPEEIAFLTTHNYPFTTSTLPPGAGNNTIGGENVINTINTGRVVHFPQGITSVTDYLYPLAISASGDYFVDQNNKPFFWSGDAGWSLIAQATTAQAQQYFDNRKLKGFTVVLANVLEHYFSTNAPQNIYHQSPFSGTAFQSTPNEAYFAHVDTIIREAEKRNILMFLFPVYLGYTGGTEGFVTEIAAATDNQMIAFGQYIGNRYKNFKNIVWCIGGDRNPNTPTNVIGKMTSFVSGLRQYDNHLITAHGPSESYGLPAFNGLTWIDFDNVYTRSKTSYTWFGTSNFYSGVISHWNMDETVGTTLADDVGNHTATKTNTLSPSSGKIGGSQYFNFFNTEYANVPNTSIYSFASNSSFTISYWMKFTDISYGGQDHIIISKGEWNGGGSLADGMWASGVNGSGKVNFLLRDNTGFKVDLEGAASYNDGQWHYVTCVRDGATSTSYLYCDGIVIDQNIHTYSGAFTTSLPIRFASLTNSSTPQFYYMGYLDDVTIYNRALSAAEILSQSTGGGISPNMPSIFIEGAYEDDPGHVFTDAEQRYTMYSTFLSGGVGYIFGNIPLFGFGFPVAGLSDWATAMNDVQSVSMNYMQKLFTSRDWSSLSPDLGHVTLTSGYGTYGNADYIVSGLTADHNTFIAYVPNSTRTFNVNLDRMNGDTVRCWWYNPATGESTLKVDTVSAGTKTFISPTGDQVLLLDNKAGNYAAPGTVILPPPPPSEDNFTGKVLYIDPFGNNSNDGLTTTTPITISGITSKLDNTFNYVVFSDTVHSGAVNITNLIRTAGGRQTWTTWHKYGTGNATISGLKTMGTFTQSGNYWSIKDVQLFTGATNADQTDVNRPDYQYYITYSPKLYIDGTAYNISRYPAGSHNYLTSTGTGFTLDGNGNLVSFNSITDNNNFWANGYWAGATLATQAPTWVLAKTKVSNYSSHVYNLTDAADEEFAYGTWAGGSTGLKYYLLNHRNAALTNGSWYSKQANDSLVVFYNSNLNSHVVKAAIQDQLLGFSGCQYITVKNLTFIGANIVSLRLTTTTGMTIDKCIFKDAPWAAIYSKIATDLVITNNQVLNSGSNGITIFNGTNIVITDNTLNDIGSDETYVGDRNGTNGIAITANGIAGPLNISRNHINKCAYAGITTANLTPGADNVVKINKNLIEQSMWTMSDGAGIYMHSLTVTYLKQIRGNIILNTYDNRAFQRSSQGQLTMGIYLDTHDGAGGDNKYWQVDSNYIYAAPSGMFASHNCYPNYWRDNLIVGHTNTAHENFGMEFKETGPGMYNSEFLRNKYIAADSGQWAFYWIPQSPVVNNGNNIDYNIYSQPFQKFDDKIWIILVGSTQTPSNLTTIRASSLYEDHSTYNSAYGGYKYSSGLGVTKKQFLVFLSNWSATSHVFSLGSMTVKDESGSNFSTSVTVPAYSAKCYMYVSGTYNIPVTQYP
jgi:hypothetical protein